MHVYLKRVSQICTENPNYMHKWMCQNNYHDLHAQAYSIPATQTLLCCKPAACHVPPQLFNSQVTHNCYGRSVN